VGADCAWTGALPGRGAGCFDDRFLTLPRALRGACRPPEIRRRRRPPSRFLERMATAWPDRGL